MDAFLDFLTSSTSPWWTTLVGVALGYFFSRANESRKAKRDADQLWITNVQNLASDYVGVTLQYLQVMLTGVELFAKSSNGQSHKAELLDLDDRITALGLDILHGAVRLKMMRTGSIATQAATIQDATSHLEFAMSFEQFDQKAQLINDSIADLIEATEYLVDKPSKRVLGRI